MSGARLVVDWTRCDGHGLCGELLPEIVSFDDWGFPMVGRDPVPAHLGPLAERAVRECPVLALRLQPAADKSAGVPSRRAMARRHGG